MIVQRIYDETQTYHDGKWMMFEPTDTTLFDDFIRLNQDFAFGFQGRQSAWFPVTSNPAVRQSACL